MANDDEIVQTVLFKTSGEEDLVAAYEGIAKAAEDAAARVASSAADSSKAFDGLQTNLKGLAQTFSRGFGEGMKGVIEPITNALNRLSGGTIGAVVQGFASIGQAFRTVKAGAAESTVAMNVFNAALAKGGVKAFGGELGVLRGLLGSLGPVVAGVGIALGTMTAAIGIAVAAIATLVVGLSNARVELDKQAKSAGESTKTYEELVFAFEQFGGHAESVAAALGKIQQAQQRADEANKTSIGTYKELGVALLDSSGNARKASDVLADVIRAINNLGSEAEKNAVRTKLFSKAVGTDLALGIDAGVAKLNEVGASLRQFRPEIVGLSEDANGVTTAFGKLGSGVASLGDQLLHTFGGPTTGLINAMAEALGALNRHLVDGTGLGGLFVEKLLDGMTQLLGETNPLVAHLKQVATEMGLIKPKAEEAAAGIETVGTASEKTNQVIIHNGQTGKNKIVELGTAATEAGSKFTVFGQQAGQTVKVINGQTGQVTTKVLGIGSAAETSAKGFSVLDDASQRTYKGFAAIGKGAESAFADVEKSSTKAFDRLAPEAEAAGADVEKVASKIGDAFKNIDTISFPGLEGTLDGVFNGATNAANAAVSAITSAFEGMSFPTLEASLDGIFNGAIDAANAAAEAIPSAFDGMSFPTLEGTLDGIFNGAVDAANTAVSTITSVFEGLSFPTLEASFDGIFNGAIDAANAAVSTIQTAFDSINFTNIATGATTAFQAVGSAGQAAATQIANAFASFNVASIVSGFQQLATAANAAGAAISSAASRGAASLAQIVSACNSAISAMNALKAAADAAFQAALRANREAAAGPHKAMGGPIYGRGSSTSDSIPAMLSHGEWVIRAAAVKKYGHAFLSMLNGMRLPTDMLERMLGFADGGMVNLKPARFSGMPHFASGGAVSNRTLNLTIGGQKFDGLIAPEDVAEKLVRFALNEKVRSAGRKPGWYTGR
jgi:hypothetical protein